MVGMFAIGCEGGLNDEDNGGAASTPKIELSKQIIETEFESDTYTVSVTSSCSWKAESKNSWIEIETETGIAGTKELSFKVERNEEEKVREGTIILSNSTFNLVAELRIIQKAFAPEIVVSSELLLFEAEGGSQEITIYANCAFRVYYPSTDWISYDISGVNGNKVTIKVKASDITTERSAEITISNDKYNILKTVKITQKAFVSYELIASPESLSFEAEGGSKDVSISDNCEYTVSTTADWISYTQTDNGITISVPHYVAIGEVRSADVIILSKKHNKSAIVKVSQSGLSEEMYPKQRVILYTSSYGNIVTPYETDDFDANIVSNTYENGMGVILFDTPVTLIGDLAFYKCYSLTSVTIPDSVISIGEENPFKSCCNLKSFYGKFASADNRCLIVDGVLNSFAPAGLTEYAISDGITSIGRYAFNYCPKLESVIIPDSITDIGAGAFHNCYSLSSINIPQSIAKIRAMTFANCRRLASVIIPDSITFIGEQAFDGCTRLERITIPDGVKSIGINAFRSCSSLASVTIPNSVTSIGENAFRNCNSLTSVYCKPTTPPTGKNYMFDGNASERKIYVPKASVSAYKSASGWSSYSSDIVGYDF